MVLWILFPAPGLIAQNLPWRKYTTADGLPENRVFDVFEDSYGFIWLSSRNGITRFDGREMKAYSITYESELLTPLKLIEDCRHNIWILTKYGVARYDGTGFAPFFFTEASPISTLTLSAFSDDNEGNLWMHSLDSTGNNLLIRFSEGSYNIVDIDDERYRKQKLKNLFYHKASDRLFITLGKEAYILSNDKLTHAFSDPYHFVNNAGKRAIIKTSSGSYYCHEEDTLLELTSPRDLPEHDKLIDPLELVDHNADSITVTDFIHKYTFRWTYGVPYGMLRDSYGTFWIGAESGLYRLISDRFTIFDYNEGFLPDTWTIAEDINGNIWFGTLRGMLKKYDGKKITDMEHLVDGPLQAFTLGSNKLSDGRIWFTTFNGILEWDGRKMKKLDITKGQVEFIYEDTISGDIMMGAEEGLVMVRKDTTIVFEQSSPEDIGYIRSICKDARGTCWLVTESSVYTFNGKEIVEQPDSVNKVIYGMACATDNKGTVWFGGNNGLFRLKLSTGKMERALRSEENTAVKFIRPLNDGRILAGRISDFIIVDTDIKNDGYFGYTIFNRSNGFMASGCVQNGALTDREGYVWILGNEIMTRFDPGEDRENKKPPMLYVSGVDVLSDELTWMHKTDINPYVHDTVRQVDLTYKENNIRVKLTGIYTRNPEGLLYSYMIEGQKQPWSEPSQLNTLVFPTLKKGKHEILFRVCTDEGIWAEQAASLTINVKPAFWQRNIFIALAVALGIIASIIIGYIISSAYRKRKDLEMKTVREYYRLQMGRFVQQFDPHFIFNLLSSIAFFIELGEKEEANSYLLRFSNLLRRIVTEDDYIRTIEEELDFIRDYCDMQKLIMEDKLQYDISISSPEILKVHIPRMIIHNFVENAIRWGIQPKAEGGSLSVEVMSNNEHTITITDKGVGREANHNKPRTGSGKGLEVTMELIQVLNRNNKNKMRLVIDDLFGDEGNPIGTKVVLTIPVDFNMLEEM
ncbi:MAG: two-component regulator propeller domain-containing protein [Bacteroidales bacterium]|nr:two-component regulator propeller domain-containing protein [Bacteroidales bacterium]